MKRRGESCEVASAVSVGMTDGRGRGLFAARAKKAGVTVLTERPLVAMQSLDNARDVTVCRNCLGFAGDVISQLEVLSGVPRHECLERHRKRQPASEALTAADWPGRLSGLCECLEGCGEVYCSADCRSAHWSRCHRLLCVGPVPDEGAQDHPLVTFRVHAMQTNEIFLLVGEVLAQVAAAFFSQLDPHTRAKDTDGKSGDTEGSSLVAARAPFADFVQEPWWDVAVPRDAGAEDAAHAADIAADTSLPHTLRALCEESSALLRGALTLALGPLPTLLEAALSVEGFARVVGMFEQNNVGVRAPSPVPGGLRELLLADGGPGREDEGGASVHSHRGAKGLGVLREAAELVSQIIEQEEDSEDDDEDKEQVVLNRCGGQEEGGEGHGDARGCCSSTAVCASKDGEISAEGAGKTDLSAAAAAAGGEVESAEGDEDILAILRSALDGGEGDAGEDIFAPLDGTALYSLVCCMNHSCRPNCVVRYPGRRYRELGGRDGGAATADPLVAEVVLLEDVPAGEELTQSYVSREMGLTERRRALEDYGFSCACPRCLEEEAASLS